MKELLEVADIAKVEPGSIDIDKELHKLSHNLGVLVELMRENGEAVIDARYKLARAQLLSLDTVPENLPKNQYGTYSRLQCNDVERAYDEAKARQTYLQNLYDTQREYINTYKKTRLLHE